MVDVPPSPSPLPNESPHRPLTGQQREGVTSMRSSPTEKQPPGIHESGCGGDGGDDQPRNGRTTSNDHGEESHDDDDALGKHPPISPSTNDPSRTRDGQAGEKTKKALVTSAGTAVTGNKPPSDRLVTSATRPPNASPTRTMMGTISGSTPANGNHGTGTTNGSIGSSSNHSNPNSQNVNPNAQQTASSGGGGSIGGGGGGGGNSPSLPPPSPTFRSSRKMASSLASRSIGSGGGSQSSDRGGGPGGIPTPKRPGAAANSAYEDVAVFASSPHNQPVPAMPSAATMTTTTTGGDPSISPLSLKQPPTGKATAPLLHSQADVLREIDNRSQTARGGKAGAPVAEASPATATPQKDRSFGGPWQISPQPGTIGSNVGSSVKSDSNRPISGFTSDGGARDAGVLFAPNASPGTSISTAFDRSVHTSSAVAATPSKSHPVGQFPPDSKIAREATCTPGGAAQGRSPSLSQDPQSSSAQKALSKQHQPQTVAMASDLVQEEQDLFESRLRDDPLGVAVRKINQNGKSQLRYVRCVAVDSTTNGGTSIHSGNKRLSGGTSIQSNMSRSVGLSREKKRLYKRKNGGGDSSLASKDGGGSAPNENDSNKLLSASSPQRNGQRSIALQWGHKTKVTVVLERFTCVRKGKTTGRTRRNPNPPSHLLSVLTDDPLITLDIEAPTRIDRDKFARAFARFLGVPLVAEGTVAASPSTSSARSQDQLLVASATVGGHGSARKGNGKSKSKRISSAHTAPDLRHARASAGNGVAAAATPNKVDRTAGMTKRASTSALVGPGGMAHHNAANVSSVSTRSTRELHSGTILAARSNASTYLSGAKSEGEVALTRKPDHQPLFDGQNERLGNAVVGVKQERERILTTRSESMPVGRNSTLISGVPPSHPPHHHAEHRRTDDGAERADKVDADDAGEDDMSTVSSLTAGFEHEIVEELHQVVHDLRNELEASRAEAARAVKVAEQAIQSAESCSSNDWNSTVTHKAAEAAAQAQKKSAEAMARQRLAEEKLAGERRAAAFWRRQAESAEEDAGALQTRAAAAEVMRETKQQELDLEKRRTAEYVQSLKENVQSNEQNQREKMKAVADRNRALEVHLERIKLELAMQCEESKALQDQLLSQKSQDGGGGQVVSGVKAMKKLSLLGRKKKRGGGGDQDDRSSFSAEPGNVCLLADVSNSDSPLGITADVLTVEKVTSLHHEATCLRHEFEMLRKTARDELNTLPEEAKQWSIQVSKVIKSSQSESTYLRERLAYESALRRKLQHRVQDYRGTARVYVRPRPMKSSSSESGAGTEGIISVPSLETLVLHRDRSPVPATAESQSLRQKGSDSAAAEGAGTSPPISFEFDRVFAPDTSQHEVYEEIEGLTLSILDGYSVSLLSYGQKDSGKTYTLLGNVCGSDWGGVHFTAMKHLFEVAEQRRERYHDQFSMTILEVKDERLSDLVAATPLGDAKGKSLTADASSKRRGKHRRHLSDGKQGVSGPQKLEIKSNYDGDTVVQGLTSVPIGSFSELCQLWNDCRDRHDGLAEHSGSHLMFTVSVLSTNKSTGVSTSGKIQFVDLADSDSLPRKSSGDSTTQKSSSNSSGANNSFSEATNRRYANKSLATLSEVVDAKCQFVRNVPYRNSTLTHLLRDTFEGDAKVVIFVCVSTNPEDIKETSNTIKFAERLKRVSTGVATKRILTSTEK